MIHEVNDFLCERCGNCCRGEGVVRVTLQDARCIAGFLEITVQEFYHCYTIRINDEYWLKDKPNQDCIFLNDNDCRVHQVKPRQCRDFPRKWRTSDIALYCMAIKKSNIDTKKNEECSST